MEIKGGSELCDLIGRVARGDQRGLAELYDRTAPFVFSVALRVVNDFPFAEEVTQEVYLQVWRNAGQYNASRGTPWSWLATLARSRAVDHLRSHRKYDNEQSIDPHFPIADRTLNAEQELAADGRKAVIRTALESLTTSQRQAIELSFYSGLTHSEIALRLKQPVVTVKTHFRLGMRRLRECLKTQRNNLCL